MQTFFKGLAENDKKDLSDAELDMVAGGKSQGWYFASIATLGLSCAIASIVGSTKNVSCDKEIDDQFDMQM
jgi:hypothetical protein